MANININAKFLNRIDTRAAWSLANPVLLKGETGFESDTQMFKVGDGVSTWNSLPYSSTPANSTSTTTIGNGVEGTAGISTKTAREDHTHAVSGFAPTSHQHAVTDMLYRNIDFYVEGDADTYYPVVINGISDTVVGEPTQKTFELIRGYSWTAPSTWYSATHKGGLQLYFNAYVLGWGGMNYYLDMSVGQQYSKMVADIIVPAPDTDLVLIWLRGGHALYRLIAYDKNMNITPYIGNFIHKAGTQYEQTYTPKTTAQIESAFDFVGDIRKFNTIPNQYIGGGFRNPKAGVKVVTVNDLDASYTALLSEIDVRKKITINVWT